jgi:hypothetical protein
MYSDTKLAVLLGVVVVASALAVGPAAAAGPAGTTDAGAAAERTSTPGESVTVFQTNGSAGGTTEVVLEPDSETVEPGDTVTYDLVVTNVDGGVGTFDPITVDVADSSVATVDAASSPMSVVDATRESDSRASFVASFGGDTNDTGDVRLGSVTLSGDAAGTSELEVNVTGDIFREDGTIYGIDAVRSGTVSVEQPPVEVTLSPESNTAVMNSAVRYDVVVTNVSGGVGTFDPIIVDVADSSVATIRAANSPIDVVDATRESDSRASFNTTFGADTDDTGDVRLGTVVIGGASPGTTDLGLSVSGDVFDEQGTAYSLSGTQGATVSVKQPPQVFEDTSANDTDGDGRVDDLNDNGVPDRGDAQALFSERNNPEVTDNVELFDYNGNGVVDRGDVQALFQRAKQQSN